MGWKDDRFFNSSLKELFQFIDEEDVRAELEVLFVTLNILDINYTFEFQPLSYFQLNIVDDRDQFANLVFKVNYKKNYLINISFCYSLRGEDGYLKDSPTIISDGISNDFIKPIKSAFNMLVNITI